MTTLAASSPFSLLSDHSSHSSNGQNPLRSERFRCRFGAFKVYRHSRVAITAVGGSARFLRLSERSPHVVEGEVDEDDEGVRGRNLIFSLLAKSVRVGVWAFSVAAVALVSRNVRPGLSGTPVERMRVVNDKELSSSAVEILAVANEITQVAKKKVLPSKNKASRSLFFASASLSTSEGVSPNEGVTQPESQKSTEVDEEFIAWVDNVKRDAVNEGVSEGVLNWALEDVTVSKDSMVRRKTAPEVKLTLDTYIKRMVIEQRVSVGASRLIENSELLNEISQKFGVPTHFLVSIWGIETNYGSFMGNWDIIQSLATMGFTEELEGRRKYFRGELLEALQMLEKGTAERGAGPQGEKRLRGSWAGAMGQCQFMPTSFRNYALDYDGDGHKDIWESKADIFASIANYFKEHGWKTGGPIFQKVQVPKKLDKSLVGTGVVKSVIDWEHKHGVHLNPGKSPPLPPDEMASLLMPNGLKGDAYLVCNNFRVVLRYNASDLYGFAVCELARLIQERASNPYPTPPL